MPAATPTALVIVFDGIEEIEALTPVDILRRAEIDVTVASVNGHAAVTGRNQITFSADTSLALVDSEAFDLVLLPGGPGVLELLNDQSVRDILVAQDKAGKELAALCAAPKILATHGILDGRSATSHQSVRDDLPLASNAPVVIDGHITTSQGLGTAVEFSLALVEKLRDKTTAQQIADSIHFTPSN
ncbi:DJ-1 family glyoxalase III [Pelagicoccus sp. SDUM812005]|uniref:DJ-1 family glyoxalase III n=1 Tax=Pelagicoccus sp. SDUM812005 TaxID=3041257 RepID=UPI00280D4CFF|nr:DJ-1 family glyoxalase III [Pelagicoccus sp. SDUM812005]MDQ8179774.1 DJ-1/PfpI family protein [Pelagicoccus sp. SDUM812005]